MKSFQLITLLLVLHVLPGNSHGSNSKLVEYLNIALQSSNISQDINDSHALSKMDVASAEHEFEYKIVPISNFGFSRGVGEQSLGLEVRQKNRYGTQYAVGVRSDRTSQDTGFDVENDNIARTYIRVSQGIFRNWGEKFNRASLNIARLNLKQQVIENEASRQGLIYETARQYYKIIQGLQGLEKTEKALKRSKEHLEAAISRHSVGMVSKVDVYRAELAVLDKENSFLEKKRMLRQDKDEFKEFLGMDYSSEVNFPKSVTWVVPVIPEYWEDALLKNRAEWLIHQLKKEKYRLDLYVAEKNLLPDIFVNANVEQRGEGDSFSNSLELDETNWAVQFELRSSFDFFSENTNLARKKIESRQLEREGRRLRNRIKRESYEAIEELKIQERYYQINKKRLEQSKNALELANVRYERGLSDNLDLLDAEDAYSEAELQLVGSIILYNIAAFSLAKSLGVLNMEWVESSLGS